VHRHHRLIRSTLVALVLAPALAVPIWAADSEAGAYLAARQAIIANDYLEAAPYLDTVLEADPENPLLLENAIQVYIGLGDFDAAAALAHRLRDTGARSQSAQLVLLAEHLQRSEYAKVLAELDSSDEAGPLVAGLVRAWAHLAEGRMSDTLGVLGRLIEQPGLQAFGLYHKALALAYVGDFEGAEHILSGEEAGPIQVGRRGVIARIQVLSQLGRGDDALMMMDRAFGSDDNPELVALRDRLESGAALGFDIITSPREGMAEAFFDIAGTLRGETDDGFTLLFVRIAQYLRPDHVPAMLLTAQLLDSLGQHDLAVAAYGEVPRDDPQYHLAAIGQAEALYRAERADAALEVLETLAESHGDIASVHVTRGDLLRRESRFDEASMAYDRAIELLGEPQPQHWIVYYTRGIVNEREDRWERAEADFRQALELNPDHPHVLNYLGYSLVERRESLDEALDMIERAVAGEPESGYITDSLGWVLYRLGRYEEAVAPMERAAELLPRDPIVNDHLGDVYWAVGRKLEARFQWRRALSFGPADDLDMDRIRRKLEVGLDQVLIEEGAEPHHNAAVHGN
jgi:tetratricopeptide (TPR) repeat protein